MIDNKIVGQAIAKLRQAENMTQQTLAACLNVSHQAVSKWENGAALPDVLTLLELSRMFGVTLEQLLAGDIDSRLEKNAPEAQPQERPIELKLDYEDINAKMNRIAADAEKVAHDAAQEAAHAAEEQSSENEETPETGETPESPENGEAPESKLDLDRIIEMAPFMSRSALDEMIMEYDGKCNPRQLSRLAPFVSPTCLEKLVANCEPDISWETLRRVAPFLRRETVDAITHAIAKGEKYATEITKTLSHGIKKIYHETIKPAAKNIINVEIKSTHSDSGSNTAKSGKPASSVSSARIRIFERALSEERFDWIGEHIDQLDNDELKGRIAVRAQELGMTDWLDEYMDDFCDQSTFDSAVLSGNWDYVAAHIEHADDDALALIADTAAAEGRWDWLAENIDALCENHDAASAMIEHALKANNMEWLSANLGSLEPDDDDCRAIAAHAASQGRWDWLEANIDELDGSWADNDMLLKAYEAGYNSLAVSMLDWHIDASDLGPVIEAAIAKGDTDFAAEVMGNTDSDVGAVCINLARNGHLKEVAALAENLESDTVAVLLDIASEQGDWDIIDQLNDLLD